MKTQAFALTILAQLAAAVAAAETRTTADSPTLIELSAPGPTVTVTLAAGAGIRIFYKANVEVVETRSATGDVSYELPVPTDDSEAQLDYFLVSDDGDAEGQPTIAVGGYIRIKKLNSGG